MGLSIKMTDFTEEDLDHFLQNQVNSVIFFFLDGPEEPIEVEPNITAQHVFTGQAYLNCFDVWFSAVWECASL